MLSNKRKKQLLGYVRKDGVGEIVLYDMNDIRKTCDSVRSSPEALALLVTILSEAALTTFFPFWEEIFVREFPRLRASMRSEGQAE